MDSLFALRGKDFVLVAYDSSVAQSLMKIKHDEDKTFALDDRIMLAMVGDSADRSRFGTYLTRNVQFLRFRHGCALGIRETAEFVRTQLAERLRQGTVQADALVAGWSAAEGPRLFWLDKLGTLAEVQHGAHGYAAYFVTSVLGNLWRPEMTVEEATEIAQKCLAELRTRFVVEQSHFVFKVVGADGIKVLA